MQIKHHKKAGTLANKRQKGGVRKKKSCVVVLDRVVVLDHVEDTTHLEIVIQGLRFGDFELCTTKSSLQIPFFSFFALRNRSHGVPRQLASGALWSGFVP